MNGSRARNALRLPLGLAAVAALGVWAFTVPTQAPLPSAFELIVAVLAAAFLTVFIIPLPAGEASLVHLVGLAFVFIYDTPIVIAAIVVGVGVGNGVRALWRTDSGHRILSTADRIGLAAHEIALATFSLMAGSAAYSFAGGQRPLIEFTPADILPALMAALAFCIAHAALFYFEMLLEGETILRVARANRGMLLMVELLPAPFAIAGAVIIHELGFFAYAFLTALVMVVAVAARNFGRSRLSAELRLRELTLINNVSQAMHSSLDLDALLQTVYQQVASLLGVKNFYIALGNEDEGIVSFPFAVKDGVRQQWATRRWANRLTDHVISEGKPLLITRDVARAIERLNLQVGDVQPESWLGVPIPGTGTQKAIGCLTVLSYSPTEPIPLEAERVLSIVASQAGAAIENARMYGEARYQATELAALADSMAAMSASHDPDHVLELVIESAARLFQNQKSAIFLLREDNHQIMDLARASNLRQATLEMLATALRTANGRVSAISNGEPTLIADMQAADLSLARTPVLPAEDVSALAELPLITQGDVIGVVALYFAEPHIFEPAEVELLKTFASQAALAIANSRVYAGIHRALTRYSKQLQSLNAINRELTSTLDLQRLFEVALDRAMDYATATAGSLSLYDPEQRKLTAAASRGYPPEVMQLPDARSVSHLIAARVQRTGRISLLPDVRQDPDYIPSPNANLSLLCVPIRHETQTLGVITLEAAQPGRFDDDDVNFTSQIAAQAAVAIENARLFQTVTESRDRLRAVLNSTREGVLVIDSAGRVALANPRIEEMLQIKHEGLIEQNLSDLIRRGELGIAEKLGFTAGELLELLFSLSRNRAVTAPKHTYSIGEGTPRFFERSGTPVFDEHMRVISWVIVLRDVTEEKQIEQVREDLTGMVVHDLRSPMTAVLGSLKLIEDMFVPNDQTGILNEAVDVSLRASKKMLGLVDSLLDIFKSEAGRMTLDRKPLDVRAITSNAIGDLQPLAISQSIRLVDDVPADLPPLLIDREKVERVFTNLLDNALKFTPNDGAITVRASLVNHVPEGRSVEQRFVLCEVLDDGPGIPEEYREHIFDRFAQVRGREGRRRGSGLGLAFCKMAVEAHGGHIWVQSRPEGGSAFKFTLPVAPS